MKAIYTACALAAAALACSVPAHAGSPYENPYEIGASVGVSKHRSDDYSGYGVSVDKSDTGYKIYAGYKLATELSAEVVWFDFGSATGKSGGIDILKQRTTAYGIGLAYKPVITGKLNAVARVGLAKVKTKLTSPIVSGEENGANNRAYMGLGLGYWVLPQVNVQATWDFTQTESPTGGGRRVDLFSIGAGYSF